MTISVVEKVATKLLEVAVQSAINGKFKEDDVMKLKDNALELILKRIEFLEESLKFKKEQQEKRQDIHLEVTISNMEVEINSLKNLIEEDNNEK